MLLKFHFPRFLRILALFYVVWTKDFVWIMYVYIFTYLVLPSVSYIWDFTLCSCWCYFQTIIFPWMYSIIAITKNVWYKFVYVMNNLFWLAFNARCFFLVSNKLVFWCFWLIAICFMSPGFIIWQNVIKYNNIFNKVCGDRNLFTSFIAFARPWKSKIVKVSTFQVRSSKFPSHLNWTLSIPRVRSEVK